MYYVFAFDGYYPAGGWWDFQGSAAMFEAAKEIASKENYQHRHIIFIMPGQPIIVWVWGGYDDDTWEIV